jgi:hypothetical protein
VDFPVSIGKGLECRRHRPTQFDHQPMLGPGTGIAEYMEKTELGNRKTSAHWTSETELSASAQTKMEGEMTSVKQDKTSPKTKQSGGAFSGQRRGQPPPARSSPLVE